MTWGPRRGCTVRGALLSLSHALQGGQKSMAHQASPSCPCCAAVGLQGLAGGPCALSPCRESDPESRFKQSIIPEDRFFVLLPPIGCCF